MIFEYLRNFLISIFYKKQAAYKPFPIVLPKTLRECDNGGCGYFGASRDNGTRIHKGQDYIVKEGQYIYAPFDGYIERGANPYVDDLRYKGFVFNFENGVKMKVFYAEPINMGGRFKKGDIIAIAQNISLKYPNVQNHIHVEIENNGIVENPINFI